MRILIYGGGAILGRGGQHHKSFMRPGAYMCSDKRIGYVTRVLPLVSVIIPTYNRAGVVGTAIESVLQQTYASLEIIIVDDGSTDGTEGALRRFGDKITTVRQRNSGPAAARNRGIRESRGDIVAFLDSDDLWLPEKLERQVGLLERLDGQVSCCVSNVSLAFSDRRPSTSFATALIFPSTDEGTWTNALEVLSTRFLLFNQAVAIRREVLMEIGGFNEGYLYMEDYDLALRLALRGPFAYIREPLAVWRPTEGSLSQRAASDEIRCCEMTLDIREKILDAAARADCSRQTVFRLQHEMRRMRRVLAAFRLSHGQSSGARLLGSTLRAWESLRARFFSKSPWFPKMETEALKEVANRRQTITPTVKATETH